MAKAVLQICTSCNKPSVQTGTIEKTSNDGAQLLDALKARFKDDPQLADQIDLQPVKCMSSCKKGCVAAVRAEGKYQFVLGDLDDSDDRVADMVAFVRSYLDAEDGLPVWRERPEHIRKNTLARLHPISQNCNNE
ncbi:DUF1636 domain-containing protein [uncultured Cohaesibacter sp.]|uniref:DUF1636 domain-containing protein n=1 Tax=uncultured Cohaesibacter sp. TaxID=1002546 RepID=UPI00292E160E|nr:DUF1636 domain-containing protein [uncultured Cohaesibacter sp.]